jgi:uncharacterized protein
MTNQHGDFIWYELMTPDAGASTAFYGAILDWTIVNSGQDGFDYREIQAGDGGYIGGIMQLTPEMADAHPGWVGYIAVADVDASVASIEKAGGKLCMPARDLEGVGRFAMVADPQGAMFYVMTSATGETSHAYAEHEPMIGHCGWNELATSDPQAAKAFYGQQFGWAAAGEMDMGEMGAYHFLQASDQRFLIGAAYKKIEADPMSHWLFYFRVANLDAAMGAVKANGGQIYMEPVALPDGPDFSMIAYDPQGAAFGLVGPLI